LRKTYGALSLLFCPDLYLVNTKICFFLIFLTVHHVMILGK
jgi:hypothetical protein